MSVEPFDVRLAQREAKQRATQWLLSLTVYQLDHWLVNTGIHFVDAQLRLSLREREWLGFGLRFALTPTRTSNDYLAEGITNFERKLRWLHFWHYHQEPDAAPAARHFVPQLRVPSDADPNAAFQGLLRKLPAATRPLAQLTHDAIGRLVSQTKLAILSRTKALVERMPVAAIETAMNNLTAFGLKGILTVSLTKRRTTAKPLMLLQAPFAPLTGSRMFYRLPNLSSDGHRFLHSIRQHPDIVVKPADKSLGLTIMSRRWYEQEAFRQLSDSATYRPLPSKGHAMLDGELFARQLSAFVKSAQKQAPNLLCPAIWNYLDKSLASLTKEDGTTRFAIPSFYLLPKIHKAVIKGRPIAASHSWVTTPLSRVLDFILQFYMRQIPSIVKDSREFVYFLETNSVGPHTLAASLWKDDCLNTAAAAELPASAQHWSPKDVLLAAADVESLFTNIEVKDGVDKLREFLQLPQLSPPPPAELVAFVCRAMQFVLEHNYICFRTGPPSRRVEHCFQQIEGTAMGTPAAVALANIYMFMLERPLLLKHRADVFLYKRFLDDVFAVFRNEQAQRAFAEECSNSLPRRIRLTWATSHCESEFLDVVVKKGERYGRDQRLDVRIHQKAMNTYLYIPARSFHTRKTLANFIINELHRYIRNCSSHDDYIHIKREFYHRLRIRGYGPDELDELFDTSTSPTAAYAMRASLLAPAATPRTKSSHPVINGASSEHAPVVCCQQGSCTDGQLDDARVLTLVAPSTPHSQAIGLGGIIRKAWETAIQQCPQLADVLRDTEPIVAFTKPTTIQKLLCNNTQ